ncbi:MAG: DUF3782 domain-containing protein [candidate division KSB1 bacterium]|nr:DUF3782 domain-containing protein [candidate division KSB1 bacterium]MDZ7272601.1 DUF3782 domain-containing protein [candidate division KSB1 bacterium]MDZ7284376.1 DUF3782 domain-containing protein [candidate division KSB1 bacterium]MDZ7297228.1 DUF3782 domain-containing protein [candidate division KSB1 bacterium]MDZ7308545.1 DUF3782 domain-containing protein [candidate division KSB1 bacterium]
MPAINDTEQIKSLVRSELTHLLEEDDTCRRLVAGITADQYAEKERTEDRIDRILAELKADRERQDKKWEENQRRWEQSQEENRKKWEENERRWERNQEESRKKWEENQKVIREMLASIKALERRIDHSIGALGARWGMQSEASFRNGLKAILEESFKIKVEHYQDYDEHGLVFGRPEQVELDVIIYNGFLILCEIKSSMSKSDIYAFWRKKEFYEHRHGRKADRNIVISPMVDPKAHVAAQQLGVEVYSFADEVDLAESRKHPHES